MAAPKRKSKKRTGQSKKRSYTRGKKLSRKNAFLSLLRIFAVLIILAVIALAIYHFREIPLFEKVMIKFQESEKVDLNDVIAKVAQDIGVNEENYNVQIFEDHIYIRMGINPANFDLPLVNSILRGKIESVGGELDSAKESNNSTYQLLQFNHQDSKLPFLIKIYFGSYEKQAPEVVLIIDDFGSYKTQLLEGFCELPGEVNFAILPNEPYHKEVMEKANATGHDILIHIPMEPIDIKHNNPGEDAILVQYSKNKIESLMQQYIRELPLAIAANNHMGSLATSRSDVMRPVLKVLDKEGLFFIDSVTTPNSVVEEVAREELISIFKRDLFLDDKKLSQKLLNDKISQLIKISQRKNRIIVIGHCHSQSKLDFIEKFIDIAVEKGFVFSKISTLIKNKEVSNA